MIAKTIAMPTLHTFEDNGVRTMLRAEFYQARYPLFIPHLCLYIQQALI